MASYREKLSVVTCLGLLWPEVQITSFNEPKLGFLLSPNPGYWSSLQNIGVCNWNERTDNFQHICQFNNIPLSQTLYTLFISEHEGAVIQLQVFTCRAWKDHNQCTATPRFSKETQPTVCLWLQVCCWQ